MNIEKTMKDKILVSYLSETLNGCLTLTEIAQNQRKSDYAKIQAGISELFTLYHSTKLFYLLTNETHDIDCLNFFTNFEDFYFELKHYCLYETAKKDFQLVEEKFNVLKKTYEKITDRLNNLEEN
jgi:hypothetical protein